MDVLNIRRQETNCCSGYVGHAVDAVFNIPPFASWSNKVQTNHFLFVKNRVVTRPAQTENEQLKFPSCCRQLTSLILGLELYFFLAFFSLHSFENKTPKMRTLLYFNSRRRAEKKRRSRIKNIIKPTSRRQLKLQLQLCLSEADKNSKAFFNRPHRPDPSGQALFPSQPNNQAKWLKTCHNLFSKETIYTGPRQTGNSFQVFSYLCLGPRISKGKSRCRGCKSMCQVRGGKWKLAKDQHMSFWFAWKHVGSL